MRTGPAPKGLGSAGTKLWKSIASVYELRADEARVLEDAAKIADTITRIEDALEGEALVSRGSRGQPVAHPLLAEQLSHRLALAAALRQLRLPDADGERPNQHREAAQARWARAHGASSLTCRLTCVCSPPTHSTSCATSPNRTRQPPPGSRIAHSRCS